MVTCVICKEEVSKRQSLAVAGGRACRKHAATNQGAADAQEALAAVQAEGRKRTFEGALKALRYNFYRNMDEYVSDIKFVCSKYGYTLGKDNRVVGTNKRLVIKDIGICILEKTDERTE